MKSAHSGEVEIRAPFCDLDPLEVVWHGHYVKYFEMARCALLGKLDYNYPQMRASGYAWPVIELFVRYARPIRFEQKVRVRADLVEWEYRLKIAYAVTDADTGERLARGHTVQVAVRAATGETCFASPDALRRRVAGGSG